MTSTKAIAAAISGPLVTIACYYLQHLPGWAGMPIEVHAAYFAIVAAGIPALLVYHAPANKQTVPVTPPAPATE